MVLTRDLGTLAKRSTWRARVLREIIITTETHHCETLAMLLLADAEAAAETPKRSCQGISPPQSTPVQRLIAMAAI